MTASSPSLAAEIVDTLESHGLPRDEYRLGDEIDPEALERVLESGGPTTAVRLSVRDIPLLVTADGPEVVSA